MRFKLPFIEYYRLCDDITAAHAADRLLHDLEYPHFQVCSQCILTHVHTVPLLGV
jgi:hypothetical protein